ncbi:MAG: hypothetical protein RJA24_1655, partial [Pseudomonadota bacterium]
KGATMELEQLAVDLDWDDDLDESLLDDDFDADAEFEMEFTLGRDKLVALGFSPNVAY